MHRTPQYSHSHFPATDEAASRSTGSSFFTSAGIPDAEEGARLLDEFTALGMYHNTFKPGTVKQVDAVLAIADKAPQHTVFLHLEGGKAGGHPRGKAVTAAIGLQSRGLWRCCRIASARHQVSALVSLSGNGE